MDMKDSEEYIPVKDFRSSKELDLVNVERLVALWTCEAAMSITLKT